MTILRADPPVDVLDLVEHSKSALTPSLRTSGDWAAVADDFRKCASTETELVASQLLLDVAVAYDALARHVAALESLGIESGQAGNSGGDASLGTQSAINRPAHA